MPRRFLSIRQSDREAYHDRWLPTSASTAVERRALKKLKREDVKKSDLALAMRRLRQSYRTRHVKVCRERAAAEHDRPQQEDPRIWNPDPRHQASPNASPDWKRFLT